MDIQRKKGILDICVLAALKNKPSYGYELIVYLFPNQLCTPYSKGSSPRTVLQHTGRSTTAESENTIGLRRTESTA